MDQLLHELVLQWEAVKAFFAFDTARLAEPAMLARLCLQVLLLAGSAFFSSSETALFSLSRLDLQQIRRERNPNSEILHALLDQPRRLIISILSGNELVNIAAAANMTVILVDLYGVERAGWINLLVMVPLLLLFGEVTPKTIAVSNPVRYSTRVVASPMNLWVKIVTPLRLVLRQIADRITTLIVGEQTAADNLLRKDEFLTLVEEVANEGELNATERALIYNLLEAGDTEIVEIMTPRTRTKFLRADMSVPEMIEQFRIYQHPRVPVYRGHRDNLVGFVHSEDVLRLILDDADLTALEPEDIMHPPVVVPLTKKVDEMFEFFQAHNARAAACLNEFGGMEGFITMRDVLRFIFGQVGGKSEGEDLYRERDENTYEVAGDMKLNDFNNLTNFGIEDPRMTTIGGVAFRYLDRLPKVGDKITIEGITITVLEMDAHRIARVQVAPAVGPEKGDEEVSAAEEQVPGPPAGTGGTEPAAADAAIETETSVEPGVESEAGEPIEPISEPTVQEQPVHEDTSPTRSAVS